MSAKVPDGSLGRWSAVLEVMQMNLKNLKSVGRFAIAVKSWLVGGAADDARIASQYQYRDGERRPCPGPYALLAGISHR
jgi:hypothetical protein